MKSILEDPIVPLGILSAAALGLAAGNYCSGKEPQIGRAPSIVQPTAADKAVQKLRPDVGLLEIEDATVRRAYCWKRPNSVVEGPWVDSVNDRLWVWLFPDGGLANFDGQVWRGAPLPVPADMLRGDWMQGYRGSCSTNAFWLEGGRHAWPWDSTLQQWRNALDLPSFEREHQPRRSGPTDETDGRVAHGRLRRIFFVQGMPYIVVNYMGFFPPERSSPWFLGDSVHRLDGQWLEVPNLTGEPYLVRQTLSLASHEEQNASLNLRFSEGTEQSMANWL